MIEHLEGTYETISYRTDNGIKLYRNSSSDSFPHHWHTGIEIIYPISNTYTVHINKTTIQLNPNDILIIGAGQIHSIESPSTYGERLILQIDYQRISLQKDIRALLNTMNPYYLIKSSQHQHLCNSLGNYLLKIEGEYNNAEKYFETYMYSQLEQFFVSIGRYNLKICTEYSTDSIDKNEHNNHNMEQFVRICDYINQNYQASPSLETAASITGYSKSYFCKFFKHFSGSSYYDFLHTVKLSHATSLLCTTNKKITEIAMECGFNSISTFNRVFHKYYQYTPSEYRRLRK